MTSYQLEDGQTLHGIEMDGVTAALGTFLSFAGLIALHQPRMTDAMARALATYKAWEERERSR